MPVEVERQPWNRLVRRALADLRGDDHPRADDRAHLDAVMAWLARAHDAAHPGVAAGYHWLRGWDGAYPETTGYIIPTCLRYVRLTGDDVWRDRARRMGRWLRGVQRPDGAIPGRGRKPRPVVFDTGQVIFGWLALHRLEGDEAALAAARRAGDWLLAVQEDDGAWRRHEFNGVAHAYNSRVAWPLLLLAEATGDDRYRTAGERFLRWALAGAQEDGWIEHMAFAPDEPPFTHTLAYTLEGFWAAAPHCDAELGEALRAAVRRAVEAIGLRYLQTDTRPQLPGRLGPGWLPRGGYDCLTGNAQLARLLLWMAEEVPAGPYRDWADRLLASVARHHDLRPGHDGISGGIAGSNPFWGGYLGGWYPNWAAKFAADAWMARLGVHEPAAVG